MPARLWGEISRNAYQVSANLYPLHRYTLKNFDARGFVYSTEKLSEYRMDWKALFLASSIKRIAELVECTAIFEHRNLKGMTNQVALTEVHIRI